MAPYARTVVNAGLVGRLLVRPALWPTAVKVAWRMAPDRWWRHWPPKPVPTPEYLRFRSTTNRGEGGPVVADDLIAYLRWCRSMRGTLG